MTTQKYLFFNELTQEWEETTLAELATLDNESALVCPILADGTPGAQTTYGELLKAAVPKTQTKKKDPAPAPAPSPVPAASPAPPAPEEKHQPVMLSKELENTIFFTCRVFNMFALASYYSGALLFCQYEKSIAALIIAAFLHFVVYLAYLDKKVR